MPSISRAGPNKYRSKERNHSHEFASSLWKFPLPPYPNPEASSKKRRYTKIPPIAMINSPPARLISPSKATPAPFRPSEFDRKPAAFSGSGCPSRVRFFPSSKEFSLRLRAAEDGRFSGAPVASTAADDDDDLCPVDCVTEFKTEEEFQKILEKAKETRSLVVVDFYRTSCGSCKYIAQGFTKLCKGSGDQEAGVVFLKHNVIDEYDEQSEVAERLRIKDTLSIQLENEVVPLFHFYKDGVLLEAFPTRDKEKIVAAINKYTSPNGYRNSVVPLFGGVRSSLW